MANPITEEAARNNSMPAGYDAKAGMPSAMAARVGSVKPDGADNAPNGPANTKPAAFMRAGAGTGKTTTLGEGTANVGLKGRPESLPDATKRVALDVNPVRQRATPWKA